jgi:hypothetical protein
MDDEAKPLWKIGEVNLVKGTLKARAAEDKARADARRARLEAELEAVVNRSYDGMDIPGCRAAFEQLQSVAAPYIAEFDRCFAEVYPAEFARASLGVEINPGGINPKFRDKVMSYARIHINAIYRYMIANVTTNTTAITAKASMNATANPDVKEMLADLAKPNETTPAMPVPGPAIGILARLVPNPKLWGFQPELLAKPETPALEATETKALPAPKGKPRK